jgi:hypothetical protein
VNCGDMIRRYKQCFFLPHGIFFLHQKARLFGSNIGLFIKIFLLSFANKILFFTMRRNDANFGMEFCAVNPEQPAQFFHYSLGWV